MSKVWRNQGRAGSAVEAWAGGVSARAKIDGGLVLPGTSGNYASAPDSAALSITGDIDIKVKVKMTDWTPAAEQILVAKWQTAATRSYFLSVQADGTLRMLGSTTGANSLAVGTSSVATGLADGTTKWVRVTVDVDNGAGSRDAKFYLSDDGATWTQLGTTITVGVTTSFFDSTSVLEVGSNTLGTAGLLTGTIHRVIIQDAYDTANNTDNLVFDADFEAQPDYTLSFTESSSNAAVVTVNQSATSNDPVLLEPGSEGGLYLPGVAGNYASAPDSAALSITGDIDIKAKVTMPDWTPASVVVLVAKEQTPTTRSYRFGMSSNGVLVLATSADGSAVVSTSATVANGFADGATKWVRATLDVDDGAGNRVGKFYTSDDGNSWTQLGTTITTAGTTSIFDSTSVVEVGSRLSGVTEVLTGTVHRVIIQSAYDTADNTSNVVFDANFDAITSHSQTTFTEQSSNAATVTINRSTTGRKAVAVPSISKGGKRVWLFGTDDFLQSPDNAALDIGASDSATMMVVHRHWSNFGTNDTLLAKKADTTNTTQGYYMGSGSSTAAQTQGQMGDGTAGATATQTTSRTAGALSTSFLVRNVAADTLTLYLNGVAGTPVTDATTTTLSNSEVFRIGRLSGAGTEYLDAEIYAVGLWKRALTATEITALHNFYAGRIP